MFMVYPKEILKMARLQNEVGTKYFDRGTNFVTKNAPKFSPKMLSLNFVGPEKSHKVPAKFPSPKIKENSSKASAGARGEEILGVFILNHLTENCLT